MNRATIAIALLVLATGCHSKSATVAATAAASPRVIEALTDQTEVYSCPSCGMDFDRPGQCTMDHVDLVRTGVAYICPADNRAVERSGKCPRCAANATVRRTALAPPAPKAPTGN